MTPVDVIDPESFGLGGIPSPADPHDLALELDTAAAYPRRFLLGKDTPTSLPPHLNQHTLPECGGYSGASLQRFNQKADGKGVLNLDPHWLYHRAQARDGIAGPHEGTTARGVLATLLHDGIPVVGRPDTAAANRIASYATVPYTVDGFCRAIVQYRSPLLVGMAWPRPFFHPVNGIATRLNGDIAGGHLIDAVGYDLGLHGDLGGCALLFNTWGDDWGGRGNVWVPFAYLLPLVHDLWKALDKKGS